MLPVCRTLVRTALVISLSHLAWCQPVGWNELWDNHLPQSRTQFQEQLRAQADHADALRGLGWLCQMEGDFAGVLQSWGRLVEVHPDLPQALAVWPEVSEAAARLGRTAWLAQLSTRLLDNPRSLPVLKDCARGTLAALRSTASDALPQDAAVIQWKAIGPFGNVSGSGFEKVMAVEEGGPAKVTLAGKNGLQLRWQKLQSPGREVDLGQLSQDDDSVFYLASALTSVEAGPAELSVDALGAMKLWLNGKLVFLHSSYGDNAGLEMPFRVPVQLQSGPNTLVVKMANRDAHSPSFVILVRDAQGAPLKFEAHPELADLSSPLTGQIPESVPQGVSQLQRVTGEPDSGLWLARHLALNGQAEDAVAEGRRALQQHPHSALIQWELSQRLNEDGLTDEARQLRNQALESVPSLFQANLDRLEDEADGQTQLTGLRQMVGRQPDDFDTQMQLYRAHSAVENDGEAQKVLLALAQRQQSPDNLSTLILYMNLENMNAEALKLLARGLQQYPFNTTLRRLERELPAS